MSTDEAGQVLDKEMEECKPDSDEAKKVVDPEVEKYMNDFNNIVCGGFISLAIGLGQNVGLFDVLKRLKEPADLKTIASEAKLKERYVQEWLGCMVASKIVDMEGDDKYLIPEKCKDSLGMAWFASATGILGSRENVIENLFQRDSKKGINIYDGDIALPLYEWNDRERFAFIDDRLDKGALPRLKQYQDSFSMALDVGCAGGILSTALAKRNLNSTVIGIDLSEEAIKRAEAHAQKHDAPNAKFLKQDVTSLPSDWENMFDLIIMFDTLHDLPDPDSAMKEMTRVMSRNGIMMVMDPKMNSCHKDNQGSLLASAFYAISMFNCLPNSLSTENAAGLGVGWGWQKEEEFLLSHNLKILDKSDFTFNEYSALFICKKKD